MVRTGYRPLNAVGHVDPRLSGDDDQPGGLFWRVAPRLEEDHREGSGVPRAVEAARTLDHQPPVLVDGHVEDHAAITGMDQGVQPLIREDTRGLAEDEVDHPPQAPCAGQSGLELRHGFRLEDPEEKSVDHLRRNTAARSESHVTGRFHHDEREGAGVVGFVQEGEGLRFRDGARLAQVERQRASALHVDSSEFHGNLLLGERLVGEREAHDLHAQHHGWSESHLDDSEAGLGLLEHEATIDRQRRPTEQMPQQRRSVSFAWNFEREVRLTLEHRADGRHHVPMHIQGIGLWVGNDRSGHVAIRLQAVTQSLAECVEVHTVTSGGVALAGIGCHVLSSLQQKVQHGTSKSGDCRSAVFMRRLITIFFIKSQ